MSKPAPPEPGYPTPEDFLCPFCGAPMQLAPNGISRLAPRSWRPYVEVTINLECHNHRTHGRGRKRSPVADEENSSE